MALFHREVKPGIFHIGDGRDNFCTLVVGSKGALLFDTMMGFEDLRGYVAALTPFAPVVVNSHCHFDHMGGNYQFDEVWLGEADFPLLGLGLERIPVLTETLRADLTAMLPSYDAERHRPLKGGEVWDLGGKTVEVIPLPGHTPGSVGLLCRENRLLLAGDALSPQYCIFFRESLPLAVSKRTLDFARTLDIEGFLSAHFDLLFPADYIARFRAALDLPGTKRGMQYTYEILPDEHGRFFVLELQDPATGQLIGAAVKEADAPAPERKKR